MMFSWNVVCCLLVTVYAQQLKEGNFYNRQPSSNFQRTEPSYSNRGQGSAAFPQNNWRQWKPPSVNQGAQNAPSNNNGLKTPLIAGNYWQKEASVSGGNLGTQPQVNYNRQSAPPPHVYYGQGKQIPHFNYNGQRATSFLGSSYNGQSGAPLKNPQPPQDYKTRQGAQPLNYNKQIVAPPNTYNGQIPQPSQNYNNRQGIQTLNYNGQRETPSTAYNGKNEPASLNYNTRQNVPQFNNNGIRGALSTVYNVQSAPSRSQVHVQGQTYNTRQGVQPINYNGQTKIQSTVYNVTESNNGPKIFQLANNNGQRAMLPLSNNYNAKESQLLSENGQRVPLSLANQNQGFLTPSSTNIQTSLPPSQTGQSSIISSTQGKPLDSQFLRSPSSSSQTYYPSSQTRQSSEIHNTQGKPLDNRFLRSSSTSSQTYLPSSQTEQSSVISSTQRKPLDSQFLRSSLPNGGIKNPSIFSNTNTTPLPHNNDNEKISNTPSTSSKIPLEFHKELEREI